MGDQHVNRRRRLEDHHVDEIFRLTRVGHNKTEISRMTGISRTTIYAVLSGKRKLRRPKVVADATNLVFRGPVLRCPKCGRKVFLPCVACRIEKMNEMDRLAKLAAKDRRQKAVSWEG